MFSGFFLRKNRIFNKSRYARVRQLARVIFSFSLYINILIIFGVMYYIYGLSIMVSWFWWMLWIVYVCCCFSYFIRTRYLLKK